MARKKAAARPMKACCSHTNVAGLVVEAISGSKERNGVSMAALQKALAAGGYDVSRNVPRVKQAVKSLVTNGTLLQSKGPPGAVCFMLNVGAGSSQSPSKTRAAASPSPKKAKKTTPRKTKKSPRKAPGSPGKARATRPTAAKAKASRRKR